MGGDRLRGDRPGLRRLHRPPRLRAAGWATSCPNCERLGLQGQPPARRRLRHRQELHPDAGARLGGDRLRHLAGDGRAGPRQGRRRGRALASPTCASSPLRRVRPRLVPRRRDQLPAQRRGAGAGAERDAPQPRARRAADVRRQRALGLPHLLRRRGRGRARRPAAGLEGPLDRRTSQPGTIAEASFEVLAGGGRRTSR